MGKGRAWLKCTRLMVKAHKVNNHAVYLGPYDIEVYIQVNHSRT